LIAAQKPCDRMPDPGRRSTMARRMAFCHNALT
jgi:hypothetical protein